jgi:DNA polymerase sigma
VSKLQRLAAHLQAQSWVTDLKAVESAAVPVIKLTAVLPDVTVAFDLSFNSEVGTLHNWKTTLLKNTTRYSTSTRTLLASVRQ